MAIRAYRATEAFNCATEAHSLPDEAWDLVKEFSGAGAMFEVIGRLVKDLELARLELPYGDSPEWYRREIEIARQCAVPTEDQTPEEEVA